MSEADRLRLAARVQADYEGYGYAPLLAGDVKAVAGVASDVASDVALSTAAANLASSAAIAGATSASAAAASVPAAADRTVGRRVNDTGHWGLTRSTKSWGWGVAGALAEVAVDAPRWEFDPATLAPLGLGFAGPRVNLIRNPRGEGAVAGMIGSGGALPTNWAFTNTSNTVCTVVGTGAEDGLPYVDVKLDMTGTGNCSMNFETTTGAPVTGLTGYTSSVYMKVAAGAVANFNNLHTRIRVEAATVQNGANSSFAGITSGALRSQRWTAAHTTLADGTFARVSLVLTSTATASITLRIALPSLEAGPFASLPMLPGVASPGASPRAQEAASIPLANLGTRWNRRQGIIILDWASQPGAFSSAADADWMGLISWGDLTANERLGLLINPAHTSIEARITAGGVVQAPASRAISAPAAGLVTRAAVAWDLDAAKLQVAARGAVGTVATLSALPVPSHLMPGRYATSHPMFGCISGLEIRPAALFDSALAALT